jgi:hypothetical protein
VLHNGACGYRSCADLLNVELGVVVLTVAKHLMTDGTHLYYKYVTV